MKVWQILTVKVTKDLIKRYHQLAQGGVGLIIPGFMYVHPLGRAYNAPMGIHSDDMIEGLTNLVKAVHEFDSKIIFQINHAGQQTSPKRYRSGAFGAEQLGQGSNQFFQTPADG